MKITAADRLFNLTKVTAYADGRAGRPMNAPFTRHLRTLYSIEYTRGASDRASNDK